jgi:hypothetical protein
MMAATKSMIALGFASALFLGNASSTLAANVHERAQAPEIGTSAHRHHHRSGYTDHAPSAYGRTMAPDFGDRPGGYVTPDHYGQSWDPYGLRWDGGSSD